MFDRMRHLGRDLTGRSDHILVQYLLGQVDATLEGVGLARTAAAGDLDLPVARDEMTAIEHRGDEQRRELIVTLSHTLAPPIDREDLFRLSRSVDDVLDNLRDLVRECDLFDIDHEPLLAGPLEGVERGLRALRSAVAALAEAPESCRAQALEARKNDIRPRYQRAMAQLLAGDAPVTGRTMRRRELLRRVDVVGLRLGEAADALADGAVKRSH
jgi:uncharacterized protein